MYTPDSSLTTIKLKENKQAAEDMTFLNWSPCLLIRFTSLYYIMPNGWVCVCELLRTEVAPGLAWVASWQREGDLKTFFYYSYVLVEMSDATVFPPTDVFHNSTKGRLSFPYISLQSLHSPTRRHATEGKRFETQFVYTPVSLCLFMLQI